jgi:hypothetical protein
MFGFKAFFCHETCHSILRTCEAATLQLYRHPGTSIRLLEPFLMDRFHLEGKLSILSLSLALFGTKAFVVPAS